MNTSTGRKSSEGHEPLSSSLDSYGSISSSSPSPSLSEGGPKQVVVSGPPPTVPSQGLVSVSPLAVRQQMLAQTQARDRHGTMMLQAQSYRIATTKENRKKKNKAPNANENDIRGGLFTLCCADSDDDDVYDGGNDEDDSLLSSKDRLLLKSKGFDLGYSPDRGYRATEMRFLSFTRPHMRAMHASWMCFFCSYFVLFAMAPLLPQIQNSFQLSKRDIWLTNVWMMIGGIPMRFVLGPLCDTYGPRTVMAWILALCAIPCALSGLIVVNLFTLILVRFIIGAMDGFVPCQCWITSHFVREVGGTIMAIAGGLGASGSAVTQLVVGFLFALCSQFLNFDEDLAWRLALLFPAAFALVVAYLSYRYSDDCPLGNFVDVKKAGLMMQRSAVDSFRSGVYNLNSWLLFLQYAGSSGVDSTMCNGCAVYYHVVFNRPIAACGAIAFLYGISAIYARGLGGYISDCLYDRFALRGRLCIHFVFMMAQGALNIWFARTTDLNLSMAIMFAFSIMVQMSSGTCYGIVPYVDSANTGSVAGVVGAGGNVGAALLGTLFMSHDYDKAMEYMGWFTVAMGLLTPLIVVKGYRGILFGHDDVDDSSRTQHSPLMVPRNGGKMMHSPHIVKIRRQSRKRDISMSPPS